MKGKDADISEASQREPSDSDLKQVAERELAAGVLKQAAQELRRFRGATSKIEGELYLDAYRWFTLDECSSPFSFLNVCQLLNLAAENVRQKLIGDLSLDGAASELVVRSGHNVCENCDGQSQIIRILRRMRSVHTGSDWHTAHAFCGAGIEHYHHSIITTCE